MSEIFAPKIDILPEPQKQLWSELVEIPQEFNLYGGTAIALYLGHRESVDFDFFGLQHFDPDRVINAIPFLSDATIIQKSPNTLTAVVNRGGPVQVSFFGVPKLNRLKTAHVVQENGLRVASMIDLAGTKAAVVQNRAEVKDYIDIDAMIETDEIDLAVALAAGKAIFGEQFNPQLTLKALCYFDDGTVVALPTAARERLVQAVQQVDLGNLPRI